EAKAQRDLLESYLAKYREATARDSIGAASPEARIIWGAIVSTTPAYPKKFATVLVAGLGMFMLSVGFILSAELLGAASGAPAARIAPAPVSLAPPAEVAHRAPIGDAPAAAPVAQWPAAETGSAIEMPTPPPPPPDQGGVPLEVID